MRGIDHIAPHLMHLLLLRFQNGVFPAAPERAFPLPLHCLASLLHGILSVAEKFNAFIDRFEHNIAKGEGMPYARGTDKL
jgi:hypothetical protein